MYGYENSIEYVPATEGSLKDWAHGILDWIREQGANIRKIITNLITRMKNINNAKAYAEDSANAPSIISEIGESIKNLIKACSDSIEDLHQTYVNSLSKDRADADPESKSAVTVRVSNPEMRKGMNKLYKWRNKLSADDVSTWKTRKNNYLETFKNYSKTASDLHDKLNEFSAMALSYNALKTGYETLKGIFGRNSEFAQNWAVIVVGHDWATGKIRNYLGNVVKLYKTGINATNALGRKLTSKKFRDDNGDKIDNPKDIEYNKKTDKEKEITAKYIRKKLKKNGDNIRYTDLKYEKSNETADELNDALESAYDSGYEKAMHDMEIYNDIAMEGPARDYRHKQNEDKLKFDIRIERAAKSFEKLGDPKYQSADWYNVRNKSRFIKKHPTGIDYITKRDRRLKYYDGGYDPHAENNVNERFVNKKLMSKYNGKYGDTINNSNLDPAAKAALHKKYMDKYKNSAEYKRDRSKYEYKVELMRAKMHDNMRKNKYGE